METKFTFNTNGNANKVKYVLNTSDNQEIEYTEEDLKVLQILKKVLYVDLVDDFTTMLPRHSIEVRSHTLDEYYSTEYFLKVKEWLENVKRT